MKRYEKGDKRCLKTPIVTLKSQIFWTRRNLLGQEISQFKGKQPYDKEHLKFLQ